MRHADKSLFIQNLSGVFLFFLKICDMENLDFFFPKKTEKIF
jgi:hypothetical protein